MWQNAKHMSSGVSNLQCILNAMSMGVSYVCRPLQIAPLTKGCGCVCLLAQLHDAKVKEERKLCGVHPDLIPLTLQQGLL